MRIDNPSISGSLSFIGGTNSISATSVSLTGSLSGTFEGAFSSTATANISGAFDSVSASLASDITANASSINSLNAASSSYLLNTTDTLDGDLTVTGKITAQEFHTEFVSASIIYQSGSTKFGDTGDDIHTFSGSIGINIDSPTYNLELGNGKVFALNDTSGNKATFQYSSNNLDIYTGTTKGIQFGVNSTSAMTINSSGNVGIGTTSTVYLFDVFGTDNTVYSTTTLAPTFQIIRNGSTTSGSTSILQFRGANSNLWNLGLVTDATTYGGSLIVQQRTGVSTYAERMRITSSGSIGIGTTSPGYKLDVNGTGRFISGIERPVTIDGSVHIQGDAGGWSTQYGFIGSSGTNRGGFGALGSADAVSYYWIGKAYNDYALYIDGTSNAATFTSSVTATDLTLSSATTPLLQIIDTTNSKSLLLGADDNNTFIRSSTSTPILLQVNGGDSALTLASTGAATFSSNVTAVGSMSILGSAGAGKKLYLEGSATKYNFMIAAQQNVDNALEITPSSTAGGSTFSNPAVIINSAGNVGIGTTVTYNNLQVEGPLNADNSGIWLGGGYVGNSLYHYADAPVGISGRWGTSGDNGAGITLMARNTASTNWYHGYISLKRDGNFYIGMDGLGTAPASDQIVLTRGSSIGIGTSSPTFATIDGYGQRGIHIRGTKESGTSPVIRLSGAGSGKGDFEIRSNRQGTTSGNMLQFGEAADTFMVIRGDDDGGGTGTRGFVGIGTTSPDKLLTLYGVGGGGGNLLKLVNSTGTGSSGPSMVFNGGTIGNNYVVGANILTEGDFTIYDTTNSSRIIIINPSGNVGIGTTSPAQKLHVNGVTKQANSGGNGSVMTYMTSYSVNPNSSNNVSFDVNTLFGIGSAGYILVEITATAYGSGGTGGGVYKYIAGGYSGHHIGSGAYHQKEVIANTVYGNASFAMYNPNYYTYGVTVSNSSSDTWSIGGVVEIRVTTTY